jgi:predicted  nucleic acid-binding Zn-ribbon protein
MDLNESKIQLKKYESQQLLVKTQKEANAISNEIFNAKKNRDFLSKTLDELEYTLDEKKEMLEKEQSEYNTMLENINREREQVEGKINEFKPEYEDLSRKKEELYAQLPVDIQNIIKAMEKNQMYMRSFMASVNDGHCSACKMELPPQFVSEVRRANELKRCPYCGRILFWEK